MSKEKKFKHVHIYMLGISIRVLYKSSHLCKDSFLFPYFTVDVNQIFTYFKQAEVAIPFWTT
jgi:hypothetical protein